MGQERVEESRETAQQSDGNGMQVELMHTALIIIAPCNIL